MSGFKNSFWMFRNIKIIHYIPAFLTQCLAFFCGENIVHDQVAIVMKLKRELNVLYAITPTTKILHTKILHTHNMTSYDVCTTLRRLLWLLCLIANAMTLVLDHDDSQFISEMVCLFVKNSWTGLIVHTIK